MGDHLEGVHWVPEAHQRKDEHMLPMQCIEDWENTEVVVKQDQWLQGAFSYGRPCAKGEL